MADIVLGHVHGRSYLLLILKPYALRALFMIKTPFNRWENWNLLMESHLMSCTSM